MSASFGAACFEDPAPDWVWRLLDAILEHAENDARASRLMVELIEWCSEGHAPARSAQVRSLLDLWVGPRVPMLDAFLKNARATHAGATKERSAITRAPCGCEVRVTLDSSEVVPPGFVVEAAGRACDQHDPKAAPREALAMAPSRGLPRP